MAEKKLSKMEQLDIERQEIFNEKERVYTESAKQENLRRAIEVSSAALGKLLPVKDFLDTAASGKALMDLLSSATEALLAEIKK